jgi:hypothetical protein
MWHLGFPLNLSGRENWIGRFPSFSTLYNQLIKSNAINASMAFGSKIAHRRDRAIAEKTKEAE